MKQIKKRPTEVFGFDCDANLNEKAFRLAIKQQYCKYIKSTCVKPRKSEPTVKVGICSLGASMANDKAMRPVIICPQRFKEESVFETVRQQYLESWKNVKWIPEVNIGVGGSVDFVAVEVGKNGEIKDFLCVELQAAGTTGSPYPAVQEIISSGKFESGSYNYGINWANEFSKTMMQQAYKKGKILESWKRKIVFVVQDVAIDYLKTATDCSMLTRIRWIFALSKWFGMATRTGNWLLTRFTAPPLKVSISCLAEPQSMSILQKRNLYKIS